MLLKPILINRNGFDFLNSLTQNGLNKSKNCLIISIAKKQDFPMPPKEEVIGYPDTSRLKVIAKQPTYLPGMANMKMTRRTADMRGPELVHNKLLHKQYGIVALSGGAMKWGHFEMIRSTINRNLDLKRSFAIWRVDPPWKPVTIHGQGKKLGGGKGDIAYYTTPVRRGRIIVEVGGIVPQIMTDRILVDVAQKLPFPAKMVTHQELEQWEAEEKHVRENNINKLRWEWCIKNNILNCLNYVGKYDIEFSHYGPDLR